MIGQRAEHHRLGGHQVEHVDGAPPPHLAAHQLAGERVARPAVEAHRHDVGVAHQAQRRGVGVRPLHASHQRSAARRGLVTLQVEARTLQVGGQQIGIADLVARFGRAVVDALVANKGLE